MICSYGARDLQRNSLDNVDRRPAPNLEDAGLRVHGGRVARLEPTVVRELFGRLLRLVVVLAEDVLPANLQITGDLTLVALPEDFYLGRAFVQVGGNAENIVAAWRILD